MSAGHGLSWSSSRTMGSGLEQKWGSSRITALGVGLSNRSFTKQSAAESRGWGSPVVTAPDS